MAEIKVYAFLKETRIAQWNRRLVCQLHNETSDRARGHGGRKGKRKIAQRKSQMLRLSEVFTSKSVRRLFVHVVSRVLGKPES